MINNSSNYDANVTVTCVPKEGTTAKYTSIKNKLENDATVVKAKSSVNGTLTVSLDKVATESVTEEYTCKLEFNAVERDTLASSGPYYAFGTPTTASATDYTTLGKNVFVRLGVDESKAVCINDNGLFCIKPNDYDNSKDALKNHFGESACSDSESSFRCRYDAFNCNANSNGSVSCNDNLASEFCTVYSADTVICR